MQREYATTFLGITADDIEDFVTIRRRFDHRYSLEEVTGLLTDHEIDLKFENEKYLHLINSKEMIEQEIDKIKQSKSLNEIVDFSEQHIPFPYRSFLNLRHWRKAPKSLKLFFQALACLFSIRDKDFLTELKRNQNRLQTIQLCQPLPAVMDEFRMKYSHLIEISPTYIRNKSLDAYIIAVWMYSIEENERHNRLRQPQREIGQQLKTKLIQLNLDLANKQSEVHSIEAKIKSLQMYITRTEKHRQLLLQSN